MTSEHKTQPKHIPACHAKTRARPDFLLWGSLSSVLLLYLFYWLVAPHMTVPAWLTLLGQSIFEIMNTIWWGITLGMLMVAILGKIPREFVMAALGPRGGLSGILRATLAGLFLDLCSHGILMVGAKLYERGASNGQIIAFLVASPWNSFSLTLVLWALVGLKWTLVFIFLSLVIAVISGLVFEKLSSAKILPQNPNTIDLPPGFRFFQDAKTGLISTRYDKEFFMSLVRDGISESRMVLRWILFGVLLAAAVRAFVNPESFATYFGPSLMGLGLTVVVATIIEVCSEGSTPIAADLVTRAGAPGNGFAFLMTGVATDYTEIMVLRDTVKSWKFALFLPLVTVPQVLAISWILNISG